MTDVQTQLQDLRYLQWSRSRKSSETAGSFLKSYEEADGRKLYYKLSDYDPQHGIIGHECINEIIAQRVMDLLGIPHLSYTLLHAHILVDDRELTTWLCRSYDFKEPGESKLALEDYYAMERLSGESPLDFCLRMGWEEYLKQMLVIDFLIANRDRHGANLEVLLNRKKKTIRLAPLFDQGLSFACRCHSAEELKSFDVMQDLRIQSFIGTQSAFDNLKLLPDICPFPLPARTRKTREMLFADLKEAAGKNLLDKIYEMLERRWDYLEAL